MPSRKLALRSEALSDLRPDELRSVAGAGTVKTVYCDSVFTYSVLVTGCLCSGMWLSLNMRCDRATEIVSNICD